MNPPSDIGGEALVLVAILLLPSVVGYIWLAFSLSQLFKRLGTESWRGWVPILNEMTLLERGGVAPWKVIFYFFPVLNLYGLYLKFTAVDSVGKRFGRGTGMAVLGALFTPLWATMLVLQRTPATGAAQSQAPQDQGHRQVAGGMAAGQPAPRPGQPAPAAPGAPHPGQPGPGMAPTGQPHPGQPHPGQPAPGAQQPDQFGPPGQPAPRPGQPAPAAPGAPRPGQPAPGAPQSGQLGQSAPEAPRPGQPAPAPTPHPGSAPAPLAPGTQPSAPRPPAPGGPGVPQPGQAAASAPPAPPVLSAPQPGQPAPSAPMPEPAQPDSPPAGPSSDSGPIVVHNPWARPATPAPVAGEAAGPTSLAEGEAPAWLGSPANASAAVAEVPAAPLDDEDDDDGETVVVDRRPKVEWHLNVDDAKPLPLEGDKVILGRRPSATEPGTQTLAVPDSTRTLSKAHARLELVDGEWSITDLNSTNGVLVVDESGEEALIAPGETVPVPGRFILGKVGMHISFDQAGT